MVAVSADNLPSQALGGFIGLQSAKRKCRFCMATDKDIDSKVNFWMSINHIQMAAFYIICIVFCIYSLVQRNCKLEQ